MPACAADCSDVGAVSGGEAPGTLTDDSGEGVTDNSLGVGVSVGPEDEPGSGDDSVGFELGSVGSELGASESLVKTLPTVVPPGEPDTDPLFARLAADGKRLLLPRVHEGDIVVCDGSGPMAVSRFGISEPTGPALPFEEVGLVIVPGLAFTPAGFRLGYGGGFYDRFLPQVAAPTFGVCFTEQLVDALPVEPHDVAVQQVISA